MERAKVLIFAGIGAVTAMVIYGAAATKKAGADGHTNRLARIEALMNEGAVNYRPSFFHKHHETHERVAGLDPVKTVTEVAPVKDTKVEEAKKAADKKAADDKKKKEDDAKKKKKKKKKEDAAPTTSPVDAAKPSDDEKKKDESANTDARMNGGQSAMPIAPFTQQDPNKIPVTVEEWIAYLVANPSFEKTSKFIQLAQIGVVKSEVFYPVVEKMLSSEGRLPEFGVMALGSLPNAQSFELLAAVANEQSMPDKLKQSAQQDMDTYVRIEYVSFLGTVAATSKDAAVANIAINMIQRSYQNLQPLSSSQPTASTTRTPASSLKKIYDIYEQIATALATTGTASTDGSVKDNAARTAHYLNQILQSANAQAVTTNP
jgi:hypothetical protein